MFLKKLLKYVCLSLILLLVGCSSGGQIPPPALLTPATQRVDLAVVTRGTIEQIRQYDGIVRVSSDQLNLSSTPLRFGEFHVMVGDQVTEGQLLARMDVEHIEQRIEDLLGTISQTQESHQFENNLIRAEISILEGELGELIAGDEDSIRIARKTLDITQKNLELTHSIERQALIMRDLNEQLEDLNQQIARGELRAPYDGTVTWLANIIFGEFLYPFQTIVCISDGQNVFIEYASTEHIAFSLARDPIITAIIEDRTYIIRPKALCEEELSRYILNELIPPTRFETVEPDVSLMPGTPVIIRHYNNVAQSTLMVPINTVYSLTGNPYVYVNVNGSRQMREIETGIRNGAFVQVLSGLEEGEEVFVRR